MSTSEYVDQLHTMLMEKTKGCDDTKRAYALGYFKSLVASYVPQDKIDYHIKSLKEFA